MNDKPGEPSTPNTARIIDYWLGGSHHYPVDVQAAKDFEPIYSDAATVFRVLRRFLGRTCRFMRAEGVEQFVVFGAGLPTAGNVHEAVPDARVLYTDIDPDNIAFGARLLRDTPRAGYTYCDASDPATLDRAAMERVLGPVERVGLIFIGLAAFIPDEKLKAMLASLHAWAPPGSYLAIDFDSDIFVKYPKWLDFLVAIGAPILMRTPPTILPLLDPWQLTEEGIKPVGAWRNDDADARYPTFMYGCVARRGPAG